MSHAGKGDGVVVDADIGKFGQRRGCARRNGGAVEGFGNAPGGGEVNRTGIEVTVARECHVGAADGCICKSRELVGRAGHFCKLVGQDGDAAGIVTKDASQPSQVSGHEGERRAIPSGGN